MGDKIVVGVLVLALVISLGFNVYYYSAMVDKQATINNMRGRIVVAWAKQMSVTGYYLQDVTSNIDVAGVRELLWSAESIALSAWVSDGDLYWQMSFTAIYVSDNFSPYSVGTPTFMKSINSTAIEMIKNLAQRMRDTAGLILNGDIDIQLTRREGINPIQLLEENDILDEIINHCIDIQNLSQQIYDFSPKFQ